MPVVVQVDKAEATFKDGVLTLTLPKAEAAKPRAIKVKAEGKWARYSARAKRKGRSRSGGT